MNPAHTSHAIGVGLTLTLAVAVATALHGTPASAAAVSSNRVAVAPAESFSRLLTAPLAGPSPRPAAVSRSGPCANNRRRQLVVVSIKRQHAWACSGPRAVLSMPVTTGRSQPGDSTPRGSFVVEARVANTELRPASGSVVRVRYWIPFKDNIYGFHDAPWQAMPFGSRRYRTEGSIGCVHVPLTALRELFDWVRTGARVRIR